MSRFDRIVSHRPQNQRRESGVLDGGIMGQHHPRENEDVFTQIERR